MAEIAIKGTEAEAIGFRKVMQGAGDFFRRLSDPSGDKALEKLADFKKELAVLELKPQVLNQHLEKLRAETQSAREKFMTAFELSDFETLCQISGRLNSVERIFPAEFSAAVHRISLRYGTGEAKQILVNALLAIEARMRRELEALRQETQEATSKRGLPATLNPDLSALEFKVREYGQAITTLRENAPHGGWQVFKHLHEHV